MAPRVRSKNLPRGRGGGGGAKGEEKEPEEMRDQREGTTERVSLSFISCLSRFFSITSHTVAPLSQKIQKLSQCTSFAIRRRDFSVFFNVTVAFLVVCQMKATAICFFPVDADRNMTPVRIAAPLEATLDRCGVYGRAR